MDYRLKSSILPGLKVRVAERENQKDRDFTKGTVHENLSDVDYDPSGILVSLTNGVIGRVKEIIIKDDEDPLKTLDGYLKCDEDQNVEFKASFRVNVNKFKLDGTIFSSKAVEDEISIVSSSFMNSEGGVLYIGIEDDHNVFGIENDYKLLKPKQNSDRFKLELWNSLESRLKNKIINELIKVDILNYRGKDVCKLTIKQSPEPIFVIYEMSGVIDEKQVKKIINECYLRVDGSSKQYSFYDFYNYWSRRDRAKNNDSTSNANNITS